MSILTEDRDSDFAGPGPSLILQSSSEGGAYFAPQRSNHSAYARSAHFARQIRVAAGWAHRCIEVFYPMNWNPYVNGVQAFVDEYYSGVETIRLAIANTTDIWSTADTFNVGWSWNTDTGLEDVPYRDCFQTSDGSSEINNGQIVYNAYGTSHTGSTNPRNMHYVAAGHLVYAYSPAYRYAVLASIIQFRRTSGKYVVVTSDVGKYVETNMRQFLIANRSPVVEGNSSGQTLDISPPLQGAPPLDFLDSLSQIQGLPLEEWPWFYGKHSFPILGKTWSEYLAAYPES